MTTIIKINKSTIKKNPHAGQTVYGIPGIQSMEYEYEGNILPKELNDGIHGVLIKTIPHIISTDSSCLPKNNFYFGIIIDNSFLEDFAQHIPKEDSFTAIYNAGIETVKTSEPAPQYLYKYEDTLVLCNNCGHQLIWNQMPLNDWGEEYCLKCHEIDSFDYEFEAIEDLNLS